MRKSACFAVVVSIVLSLLLATGCTAGNSSSPASTPAPAKQQAASAAFKYYGEVDIGMAKDAVEKALGLTAKAYSGDEVPEGSTAFYYLDANGEGLYVLFDKDLKLTSKTVQYNDPAAALTPYTKKPVTQDECDKITDGMSHADVDKLLGSPGAECSKTQSVVFGKTTVGTIWRWGNQDGSFLQVVFTDGDTARNAMFFNGQ